MDRIYVYGFLELILVLRQETTKYLFFVKKNMTQNIMERKSSISRKTAETDIELQLDLDGSGKNDIRTGVPFLDHMLSLFSVHGFFDLYVRAEGDTEVDDHHTVEDIGICLGQAIAKALGRDAIQREKSLKRYARAWKLNLIEENNPDWRDLSADFTA